MEKLLDKGSIEHIAEKLRNAKHIAVLTGAGVSAESGIPTFRDALTGLWAKYDPAQLATPEAFERDAALVTEWYDQRRLGVLGCEPSSGHAALARMQRAVEERGGTFTLITQNVDRLHQRAGSTNVIELHGSIALWRCVACRQEREETGERFASYPPMCECGGRRRPGVVWFGEMLPEGALEAAGRAAESCDVFMTIGTSANVYPAASLIPLAARSGAFTAEINPDETAASGGVNISIRAKSAGVLDRVVGLAFNGD